MRYLYFGARFSNAYAYFIISLAFIIIRKLLYKFLCNLHLAGTSRFLFLVRILSIRKFLYS
jgi:hypothetical protein